MNSERELWEKFKSGDQQALESIYQSHIASLLQYGKRFVSNDQQLEDAVHDLFLQLWTRRENLGSTDSIIGYLLLSLKRSLFKIAKANLKVVGDDVVQEQDFNCELTIEELIIQGESAKEKSSQLKMAFSRLSAKQKEALYLKYYQNLDYEAIAAIMQINYQSVRNLVSKGIIRLREAMIAMVILLLIVLGEL